MRNQYLQYAALSVFLSACSLQDDYVAPPVAAPEQWSVPTVEGTVSPETWWKALGDPAIDHLVEASFVTNPTLAQAVARMDEARANLAGSQADFLPQVTATASSTTSDNRTSGGGANAALATRQIVGRTSTYSIGPSLTWELDLFQRLRNAEAASKSTLDARTEDAQKTRLTLSTDVANTVLALRACNYSVQTKQADLTSQMLTLKLTHENVNAGFSAPVDEASVQRDVATAKTNLATQQELCANNTNALVALTGRSQEVVRQEVAIALPEQRFVPVPPKAVAQLPATLLAQHPSVRAADRDAAAAWAQIGVARADRLPKVDLSAVLTGQWIRIAGSTISTTGWSLGPNISAILFDGGKGAAAVDANEARYRNAVAVLDNAVRTTVKDVEDALAAQQSAQAQVTSAGEALDAARVALKAREAGWKQGFSSLLELEDARRLHTNAEDSATRAAQARAQAWVSLVSATGNTMMNLKELQE